MEFKIFHFILEIGFEKHDVQPTEREGAAALKSVTPVRCGFKYICPNFYVPQGAFLVSSTVDGDETRAFPTWRVTPGNNDLRTPCPE